MAHRVEANFWRVVIAVSVVLGALAFLADYVPGVGGNISRTLTSSGLSWGLAALIAGYATRRHPQTMLTAVTLLLVATGVYYGLIVWGGRWRSGELDSGGSAAMYGLMSIARALAFWILASIAAGIALGYLGGIVRDGSRRASSLAAGFATGLFAGQGLYELRFATRWDLSDDFYLGIFVSAILTVLLALVALVLLLRHRGSAVCWHIFAASAGLFSVAGAVGWHVLDVVRHTVIS